MKCYICSEIIKRKNYKIVDHYALYYRFHYCCDICFDVLENSNRFSKYDVKHKEK